MKDEKFERRTQLGPSVPARERVYQGQVEAGGPA